MRPVRASKRRSPLLNELPDDWQRPPYVRDVLVATYTGLAGVQPAIR